MENRDELLKKFRAANHSENNGCVLNGINLLRHKYIGLKSVSRALDNMSEADFLVSTNFLQRAGYILLRKTGGKVEVGLTDENYSSLEGIVSSKGIRLLAGVVPDNAVEVPAGVLQKMRAGNFMESNGRVLMDIDLLGQGYVKLKLARQVYSELTEQQFLDSVNYLQMEGYIELREIESKERAGLADAEYTALEACIGERGYRLLWGKSDDSLVRLG